MKTSRTLSSRGRAVLIAATAVTLTAVSSTAWADPGTSDNYVPETESTVTVTPPPCTAGVPTVSYEIDEPGTETVDITWEGPSGEEVSLPDQPLAGELIWPGTDVTDSGDIVAFPGLEKANGSWVETEDDAWAAGTMTIIFETDQTEVVTVTYPGNPICNGNRGKPNKPATPPSSTTPGDDAGAAAPGAENPKAKSGATTQASDAKKGTLPFTGSDLALYGGIALVVIGLGVGGLVLARRARRTS